MGRQNNTEKLNGNSIKTTKPIGVRNRNLRTQNSSKSSGKKSLPTSSSNSKSTISSSTKNGNASAPDDKSAGGAKGPSDRSQLNFPFDIRINSFSSMLTTVKKVTPKIRKLLLDECDIIMECKFCRNLFRSIPNFLSHKQYYCKTMYHPSSENGCSPLIQQSSSSLHEIQYQLDTSAIDQLPVTNLMTSSSCVSTENDMSFNRENEVVVEEGTTRSSESLYKDIYERTIQKSPSCVAEPLRSEHVKLVIEPINNRQDLIVFQRRVETDSSVCDSLNNIHDTREIVDRDTAILGPDGKVLCTGTALGIERIVKRLTTQIEISQRKMVQDSTNQLEEKCDICKTVFDTEKALRQHRRDAPDCVKQSVIRYSHGTSFNNKILAANRPTKEQMDNNSFLTAVNQKYDYCSSAKRSTIDEDKARASLFVKKLFSKNSPRKVIPSNSSKSPMFAKKILSATSIKTSPLKNIGKVKKLQMSADDKKVLSPVKKKNWKRSLPHLVFSCMKCSSSFRTKCDMSTHLAICTGVINLSLRRDSLPSTEKKIGIQIRHNYSKPELLEPMISASPENQNMKQDIVNIMPSPSTNVVAELKPSNKVLSIEQTASTLSEILKDADSNTSEYSVSLQHNNNEMDFMSTLNRAKEEIDVADQANSGDEVPECETISANQNMHCLSRLTGEADNSRTSSGSEVDRESISYITDSGVSSATTPSEGHPEVNGDLSVSPTDLSRLDIPSTSSRTVNSGTRSNKLAKTNPEDRVLTPKNKNLRLTANAVCLRKRKSSRIQNKDSIDAKKPMKKKN